MRGAEAAERQLVLTRAQIGLGLAGAVGLLVAVGFTARATYLRRCRRGRAGRRRGRPLRPGWDVLRRSQGRGQHGGVVDGKPCRSGIAVSIRWTDTGRSPASDAVAWAFAATIGPDEPVPGSPPGLLAEADFRALPAGPGQAVLSKPVALGSAFSDAFREGRLRSIVYCALPCRDPCRDPHSGAAARRAEMCVGMGLNGSVPGTSPVGGQNSAT